MPIQPSWITSELWNSLKSLRHSPGLVVSSVLALGLGIGATTTMFGIVRGGTRGLPVPDPGQIVFVSPGPAANAVEGFVTAAEWSRLRTSLATMEVAAFQMASVNLGRDGDQPAERVAAATVTPDAFALLRVGPALGRTLIGADARPGAPPVAVIADDLWRRRYRADRAILGAIVRVNGTPRAIVGVMPPRFGFPVNAKVWLPAAERTGAGVASPEDRFQIVGRLRPPAAHDTASNDVTAALRRLDAGSRAAAPRSVRVVPFIEFETPREVQLGLRLLVVIVSLVLLVACANVANLLLARAAARTRDVAIRTALGASRARLIVQHLCESALLAGCATLLGVAASSAGLRFFRAESAAVLEAFWMDFRVDPLIVAFAGALGFAAAFASGLVPAIRASRAGVGGLLVSENRAGTSLRLGRLGRGLVAVQVALACGALTLTTTFVGAAGALRSVAIPFPADRVLTAQLSLPAEELDDARRRMDRLVELRDRLEAAPAIRRAAFVSVLPGRGAGGWPVRFADGPGDDPRPATTAMIAITPELFAIAGARAVRGRLLSWQDDHRAGPAAVVNESFAARHSPGREVLGRSLRVGQRVFEIVGVVPDLLMQDVEDADGAGFYLSMLQARPFAVRVMAETEGPAIAAADGLRAGVADVDRDIPVLEVAPLRDAIFSDKKILDALAALFLVFGLGAVFLATLSLHAVLSFAVTRRSREFGIRSALGASARDLAMLLARRGGLEVAWGLAIGLALAVGVSRIIAATLERAPAAGPGAFVTIGIIVATGAVLAMWRPFRRIARLNCASLLRG
jgi:predicted permease